MNNEKRRYELAEKFAKLSDALVLEAIEQNDNELKAISSFISILGSVILDSNDIKSFGTLVTMYSANKLLNGIQDSSTNLSKYYETLKADDFDRQFDELRKQMDEEDKNKKDEDEKDEDEDDLDNK